MEPEHEPIDPLARGAAGAIAGARIAIGVAALCFTRPALAGLGFEDPDEADVALARLAGGRDIALGLHALSALSDRERLREATALGAGVDLADALSFGAGIGARGPMRRTAMLNAPLAAAAAAIGVWARRRL